MFDLTFDSSVLDKMPVGTSFRDADHEVSKRVGGWKCEDCSNPDLHDSSSALMSDPSGEYALDKFAGALIDPDDLDPRLIAFLPVGTKVADRDTLDDNRWHWYKTTTGRWVWALDIEGAETTANYGMGIEDMSGQDIFRPFRLFSVGTGEAPEPEKTTEGKTVFTAAEATNFRDTVFKDDEGDTWFFDYGLQRWRSIGPGWAHEWEELDDLYGPYAKVGPLAEHERLWTAEEANDFRDEALVDFDWDTWIYDVPSEQWKCNHAGGSFSEERLDDFYQPYRIKKAAPGTAAPGSAIPLGYDEPFKIAGSTEEVTFEGSAKEAVQLLDRIARSLESISRKLGDK